MKLKEILSNNIFLYHATYKQYLDSIKKNGLNSELSKKNWEDSKKGYIYLATSKDIAISYAESSNSVPEEWLDEIIVLKINLKNLNKEKIESDSNVIDSKNKNDTLQYKGVIPFEYIEVLK